MATLNEHADNIAGALDAPFDELLKERIKFNFRVLAATLIKQDAERNGMSGIYLQRIVVPLQQVDIIDNCAAQAGCMVRRTVNKIPRPIRLTSNVDFKYVGDADWKRSYADREFDEVEYARYLKYGMNEPSYNYVDGYIYIMNRKRTNFVGIITPFENWQEAANLCTDGGCVSDDDEFPLPNDLVIMATRLLIESKMIGIKTDDKQVDTNEK
jgi:hypothetical protein